MSIASIKDVPEGSTITFRSINPNDSVTWIGTLEAIGTYRSIRAYMDPTSYNEACRQVSSSISSDVTTLLYFLITVDNNASTPTIQAFAQEWIVPGSLNIVSLGNQVTITIDDPNNSPQTILSILANAGYACKIVS
jgi:hypothetical protein